MIYRYIVFVILFLDAIVLLFQTSQVSLSFHEAQVLYGNFSFLQLLIKSSISLFGENDFGLRLVMIVLHLLSASLIYKISLRYIKSTKNRVWLLLTFVLLPGVVSSAIVVDEAGLVIFGLLLFIYLSEKISQLKLALFSLLLVLVSGSFSYLFLALFIYFIYQKKYNYSLYYFFLFIFSNLLFGSDVGGYPQGHFLDTLGVFSAILTPIIFLYIIYTLYRRYLSSKIDLLWFISSIPFLFSIVISFRQGIPIEHFAPYLIVALPIAAQTFISSYRVRLKNFRSKYRMIFLISFLFLAVNSIAVLFNKELYLFLEKPRKHFAYDMHVAKELALQLKAKDIHCVKTDYEMQKRLQFYKIGKCKSFLLRKKERDLVDKNDVTISYKNKIIYSASVTNINNR